MASPPATDTSQADPAVLRKLAASKEDASIEASSFEQDFRVTMKQSEEFKSKEKVESIDKEEKEKENLSVEEEEEIAKVVQVRKKPQN